MVFPFLVSKTSKKGKKHFFQNHKWTECSHQNYLKIETVYSTDPIFTKQTVSSRYLFHNFMYSVKVGTNIFSSSTIKISANTGPNGKPMAVPSY